MLLNNEEREMLDVLSQAKGLTMSTWVRLKLREEWKKQGGPAPSKPEK
jgi:hypothetical protein